MHHRRAWASSSVSMAYWWWRARW